MADRGKSRPRADESSPSLLQGARQVASGDPRHVLTLPERIVGDIVRVRYGVEPLAIERRPAEFATVCRVQTRIGTLGFKAEQLGALDQAMFRWQSAVQVELAEAGLPVAKLMTDSVSGTPVARVEVEEGEVLVQVYPWQSGTALGQVLPDDAALRELGRTGAWLRNSLDHVAPAPSDTTHEWELARTRHSVTRALRSVCDPQLETLVRRGLDRFAEEVEPRLARLPRAVVHHDLHDANVLLQRDRTAGWTTSAILDFGDMVNGVRVAELVVAAAYACRSYGNPIEPLAVVAGVWSSNAPMTTEEMSIVLPAVIARLALNVAVWSSRAGGRHTAYGAERVARSVETLERLLTEETDKFLERVG